MNEYEEQANNFLASTNTELKIELSPNQSCPNWGECKQYKFDGVIIPHNHGKKYIFTLSRPGRRSYTSSFWSSINDTYKLAVKWSRTYNTSLIDKDAKAPSAYDILACLSSDLYTHDLTFQQWADDLGYNADSIKDKAIYEACCNQSRVLNNLFTESELEELAEIS